MRITGYQHQGRTHVAARADDGLIPLGAVEEFWADPYAAVAGASLVTERVQEGDITLVPPIKPSARILCVGLNYSEHVNEGPFDAPEYPTLFGRWTPSLSVAGTPVAVPVDEDGLDWEVELLAVVGKPLHMVDADDAHEAVFAYGAFNDITARRVQKLTTQWTLGKNVDASGAMSDLVTRDEIGDVYGRKVVARVNGEVMQQASTDQMIFNVGHILSFISRTLTLTPGDLVATGTPSGVGYARTPPKLLQPGDSVEVEVEGIGSVTTPIVGPEGAR